jgi:acetyl-CoA carboxylase carboxyltransferase component
MVSSSAISLRQNDLNQLLSAQQIKARAAERGYVDEVIMPHSTRRRVARALRMLRNKDLENPWKKHDNIPL